MRDPDLNFDQGRLEILEKSLEVSVSPLSDSAELYGKWEMRFAGPAGSEKVLALYDFRSDGQVIVEGRVIAAHETWKWKLTGPGILSFRMPIAPIPHIPSLKDGTVQEEYYWAFKAADARMILTNFDASLIETLSRMNTR
jgi:hypothetical protein